jgi:hypothetical protein
MEITVKPAENQIGSRDEDIHFEKDGLYAKLLVFMGQQGEHFVCLIPSLNISGYGQSEADALTSLNINFSTFCDDLFALTESERQRELALLGWEKEHYFEKRFSNPSVDANEVLSNFDFPDEVKQSYLEAA